MNISSASRPLPTQKMPTANRALRLAGWLVLAIFALAQARPAHAVVHSYILINAQTGQVLQQYHADEPTHPASLTKLMTLYITFQRLQQGRLTLNQRFRVSAHAACQQPSRMGLVAGTTVSVRTLIRGIIAHSANDAAVALAENIAGSEPAFVRLMNAQARQLGMTHTIFYNASGLPNYRQWTSARDMATLALSIIQTFPQYYHYFNTPSLVYRGHTLYTFDHLIKIYPGADGMKTGYIASSGFNLVTSAVRDHHRLIGVIFGGRTAYSRDMEMVALLNRGFRTFQPPTQLLARNNPPAPPQADPQIHPHPYSTAVHRTVKPRIVKPRIEAAAVESAPAGSHHRIIQVGAEYRSSLDVRRILHSAKLSAPSLRHQGRAIVVRLRNRHYLARFADLTQQAAFQACTALRHKRYTCTVLDLYPTRRQNIAATPHPGHDLSE
ncbi:MAG: D-alanyl-D-alanine carboxypeptidase family protein [Acidobacteriaceae bacterium]